MEWNKRIGIIVAMGLLVLSTWSVQAQVGPDKYLVYFTDKDNTPYSISQPEEFLSPRAIARRYHQNIAIGTDDLPVDPNYVEALEALGELRVLHRLKWFNAVLIETTDSSVIAAITDQPFVAGMEASPVAYKEKQPVAWTQDTPKMSGDEYGAAHHQIDMINGIPLHEAGYRGEGMVVAVLDAGFIGAPDAPAFQGLFDEGRVWATKNFVDPALDVYRWSLHGSYVLSTMAGYIPDTLIGTAPEASYVLCLTEDVSLERRVEGAWWAAAAEYVDSLGADIINTSLGYSEFDVSDEDYTYDDMDGNTAFITRAADKAASKGILVVSSAGNSGSLPWHYITAPADGDSVLAIGAVTADSTVAGFSGRGPRPDGVIKPNVMAQGVAAAYANMDGGGALFGNGTSLSSPIIAGMSAALWQAVPEATAAQVFGAIEKSANLYLAPNDSMGYGIPNFALALEILINDDTVDVESPSPGQIIAFPNPYVDGFFNLRLPSDCGSMAELRIFDVRGRLVTSRNVRIYDHWIRLDNMTGLAPGAYLLRLDCTGGAKFEGRLVVVSRR